MKRQYFFGTLATLLCLYQFSSIGVAAPSETCTDVADGCVVVNDEPLQISPEEIVPDGQTVQLVEGGTLGQDSLGASTPTVNMQISRQVADLWQLEVPNGSQTNLDVTYNYDQSLQLSNSSSSTIKLDVQKIAPIVIGASSTNANNVVVQGGAIFNLDLSNVKASGTYSGNLQITITGF